MAKDKYYGKTLRKNFARHEEVMAMPNLLAIQKNSQRAADWIENFGLEILQDENRGQVEYFNSDIPPEKNEVYDLRASTTEQAEDSDGQMVRVPYPFVKPVDFK